MNLPVNVVPLVVNAILTIRNVELSSYHKCDHVSSTSITDFFIISVKKYKNFNSQRARYLESPKVTPIHFFSLQFVYAKFSKKMCVRSRGGKCVTAIVAPSCGTTYRSPRLWVSVRRAGGPHFIADTSLRPARAPRRTARPRWQLCLKLLELSPNPETCYLISTALWTYFKEFS